MMNVKLWKSACVVHPVPLTFFCVPCTCLFFLGVFLVICQAKEMLTLKLPSWQNKCSDALQVPDTIISMIEGMRTPVSNTPRSSPLVEHFDRVSLCAGFMLGNDYARFLAGFSHKDSYLFTK